MTARPLMADQSSIATPVPVANTVDFRARARARPAARRPISEKPFFRRKFLIESCLAFHTPTHARPVFPRRFAHKSLWQKSRPVLTFFPFSS